MSATYPCETCGSDSATSDYCDVCGAQMIDPAAAAAAAALAASDPTPVPPSAGAEPGTGAPAGAPTDTCYFCGAPRAANDVFCEVCGLDFVSGQMPAPPAPTPVPPPPPSSSPTGDGSASAAPAAAASSTTVMPAAASGWTAVVGADRAFFDGNVTAGVVAFPDPVTPRDVPLAGDELSIGRRSESKGYYPDIDLSSPVDDPAVSRRHAVLQRQADGSWAVIDLGSTNGTWLNAEDDPLAHGVVRALHDGDRLLLGAFTCIIIRNDAAPPAPTPTPPPAPAPTP